MVASRAGSSGSSENGRLVSKLLRRFGLGTIMRPPMKPGPLGLAALVTLLLAPLGRAAEPESSPTPLTRAHAHNDYEHSRPLWDALDQGFCSVEADIYLVNGQLLVAHDRNQVKPERT